jgi:hypothetical protein
MAQVQFALAPGRVNNEVLDYSSSEGIKLYNKATAPLETKYDLDTGHLYSFLQKVRNRAMNQNWTVICTIPVPPSTAIAGQVTPKYDLLTQYGRMTLNNIRAAAEEYQFRHGRNAQNAHQMYEFLYSSLNDEAQARVALKEKDYLIYDTDDEIPMSFANGPLFLKTIIGVVHIDTRSTAAHIRQSLSMLPTKIASLDYDVTKFNHYVKLQRGALLARGEVSTDLLVNIFTAFFVVPDLAFKTYIDRIKDLYDEGEEHVTEDYVMMKAEVKSMVLAREGKWVMPSKEDETIIALSAAFEKIKSHNEELNKQLTSTKRSANPPAGGRKPRTNTGKWAWKDVEPPTGSPHTKTVDSKTYHWCPKHSAWTLHLPSACRMGEAVKTDEPSDQVNQALAAIADDQGNLFHDEQHRLPGPGWGLSSLVPHLHRPPWKITLASLISWAMQEGLAPTVMSLIWLLLVIPLLLHYSASPSSMKSTPPHHTSRHRPRSRHLTAVTRLLSHCWHRLQDMVFSMRTRRPHRRHRRTHSTAYYIPQSKKRGSCVGRKSRSPRWTWTKLLVLATVAQSHSAAFASGLSTTQTPQSHRHRRFAAFDTDSVTLRVDNCCTACITNSLTDVIGTPEPIAARIEGFTGGEALVTARCTIKWKIEDDHGRIHSILLPNSLYSKTAPFRLLSPQHWAQQADDHHPK